MALVRPGVVLILGDGDRGGGVVGDLVWPGADWHLLPLLVGRILEEGIRQWGEGGVAQTYLEVRDLFGGFDGEGVVVNDFEAAHGLDLGLGFTSFVTTLFVGVPLDRLEEVAGLLGIGAVGGPVPTGDEILSLDLGAVGELVSRLDLDGEVLVVLGLDGLGDVHLRLGGVRVVMDKAGCDGVEDISAAGLVGVGRNERVLWGTAANGD